MAAAAAVREGGGGCRWSSSAGIFHFPFCVMMRPRQRHIIHTGDARSRLRHTSEGPDRIVCPNSDSVCPNSDKIYLTVVTFRFLSLFINEKRDSFLPSGS